MKTIITIQHTQSLHHVNGMVGSRTDWPLTELGLAQAARIAARLHEELGDRPVQLWSSNLQRAMQTAEPLADAFRVQPILRRALRERDLGECCGQSVQWLREHMQAPEIGADDRLFPHAESRRDAWERLWPCFQELLQADADTVLVVSHGDLLSLFGAMFLGLTVEQAVAVPMRGMAGSVSMYRIGDDGSRTLCRFGDMSYVR